MRKLITLPTRTITILRHFLALTVNMRSLNCLCGLVFLCIAGVTAQAQDAGNQQQTEAEPIQSIMAGVYVSPPFVTKTDDGFDGMAIELLQALAEPRGLEVNFREYDTLRDMVYATRDGEVDIAVTNLTITEARAEQIDFSHPWFDAGLQIMISDAPRSGFGNLFEGLAASGHLRVYAWIGGAVIFATFLLLFFDRHFDPNFPKRWRDGMAESFYTVMSVAATGKPPSRAKLFGWIGRIWSAVWLFTGVAVLAYVTSSVTSVMTIIAIADRISGPADLPGMTIGVLDGSTAEEYATETALGKVVFPHVDEAVAALVSGQIDAIIGDAPVLDYFAHTRPQQDVRVVGEIFEPEKYGFGIAQNSPLRRPLTVALIGAEEEGIVEDLRTQYFGPRQ